MGVKLKEELPFAHVVNSRFMAAVCSHCMKVYVTLSLIRDSATLKRAYFNTEVLEATYC